METVTLAIVAILAAAAGFLAARLLGSRETTALRLTAARHEAALEASQRDADLAAQLRPMAGALAQLQQRVETAEQDRVEGMALIRRQLTQQQEASAQAAEAMQTEARKLTRALSRTNVRGAWGEVQLRRVVESAGLVERVHFEVQASTSEGRPDMIVHLPGEMDLIVDAKAPLDALLACEDDVYSEDVLRRHAQALRSHVDTLAKRDYSTLVASSPDIVLLFLPAESLLSLALSSDPGLIDHAWGKGVVLTTPNTLITTLYTASYAWRQEALAENARQVQQLGAELHGRLLLLSKHLAKVGKSLGGAVESYNEAVGSYERRVLVSARRFAEMGVVDGAAPEVAPISASARAVPEVDITDLAERGSA